MLKVTTKFLTRSKLVNNKEVLKKNTELSDGSKNEIETINGDKKIEYAQDFVKIKFEEDLALDKPLKLRRLTIIVRSVFEENTKFYHKFI